MKIQITKTKANYIE